MRLTPPSKLFFMISLILFVVGVVGWFVQDIVPGFNDAFLVVAAWVVLALGCLMKGV